MRDTSSNALIITIIIAVFIVVSAFAFVYAKRYCHTEVRYVERQYVYGVRGMMLPIEAGEREVLICE